MNVMDEMLDRLMREQQETREGVPQSVVLQKMRGMLQRGEPKVHCAAPRRTNLTQQANYIVAQCTQHKGHEGKHSSVHVSGEWS